MPLRTPLRPSAGNVRIEAWDVMNGGKSVVHLQEKAVELALKFFEHFRLTDKLL